MRFTPCFKIDIDTADTFTADEELWVEQVFEGQNVQHFDYGSSSAKDVTLSFWVKSHVAGQYSIWFYSQDTTRYFMKEYTVNFSGSWEYKTMTIPGDTVGVIANDNGAGYQVRFYLGAGANYQGTVSTDWAANAQAGRITSSQVQLQNSTANYWQITGVQLEVGSVATPFEHRAYGDELARCQRYFQDVGRFRVYLGSGSGTALQTMLLPVAMREAASDVDFTVNTGTGVTVTSTTNHVQITGTVTGSSPNRRIDAASITLSSEF